MQNVDCDLILCKFFCIAEVLTPKKLNNITSGLLRFIFKYFLLISSWILARKYYNKK